MLVNNLFSGERLSNFTVFITSKFGLSDVNNFDVESYDVCAEVHGDRKIGERNTLRCKEPKKGQFVMIYVNQTNRPYLILCEVEVHQRNSQCMLSLFSMTTSTRSFY